MLPKYRVREVYANSYTSPRPGDVVVCHKVPDDAEVAGFVYHILQEEGGPAIRRMNQFGLTRFLRPVNRAAKAQYVLALLELGLGV